MNLLTHVTVALTICSVISKCIDKIISHNNIAKETIHEYTRTGYIHFVPGRTFAITEQTHK